MKPALITRLHAFLERNPTLRGNPATPEEIAAAEKELGLSFHDSYKTFIQEFGDAYTGIAIHAFSLTKRGSDPF